jgi:hypothetical protein
LEPISYFSGPDFPICYSHYKVESTLNNFENEYVDEFVWLQTGPERETNALKKIYTRLLKSSLVLNCQYKNIFLCYSRGSQTHFVNPVVFMGAVSQGAMKTFQLEI